MASPAVLRFPVSAMMSPSIRRSPCGRDLREKPLTERKRRLERLIPKPTPVLSRVLAVASDGRALFEAAQRLDLEGIVAKRKADPYAPGVTWYKIMNRAYTQMEGRGDLFHGPR